MLIFTRRAGESFHIGDDVVITVLENRAGIAKIGVSAPRDVEVHRQEIYDKIQKEKRRKADQERETLRLKGAV